MKVLIIRMYPDVLDIENYNCQEIGLAKALIRKKNQCDIVLYTDGIEHESDVFFDKNKKIHIYYLNAKSIFKNAIFSKKLYEIANKYDVIQTSEYDQIGNVKLRKKIGNRMIIYHGPYQSDYTKGYKIKCMFSDFYFFFHKEYKDVPCITKSRLGAEFLKKKGFKNITTIGVGVDIERFKEKGEANKIIKNIIEKKKKENLKYLLYIGKIEERRNIIFLIDLLNEVLNNDKNIRLIIVGNGKIEYIDKCFRHAKEKCIQDKIYYYKSIKQEELPNLYENCDIFLLPTRYEIFGMVLLEAMYFGIPTITSLNGGSSTLIQDNVNGYICSTDSIEEWTEKINIIIKDEKVKNSISMNASNKIINNYTWDKLANKFEILYNKNLNAKQRKEN